MSTTLSSLNVLKALVKADMEAVEEQLSQQLSLETYPAIREINSYLIATPGKRLRPMLCLYAYHSLVGSGHLSEKSRRDLIRIAASLELIHMASLVHDDIIDHAPIRHNQPSIQAKWGMETAIPVGVYLYSHSLKNIAEAGNFDVLRVLSHAVKNLCVGEMTQVLDRHRLISIPHYLIILKKKTGVLFSAACQVGAIMAGADKHLVHHFKHYGNSLGLAFQILDDYMDIMGHEDELKKQPGQDVELGELTLPLLYHLDNLTPEEQSQLLHTLKGNHPDKIEQIQHLLRQEKSALEKTKALANYYLDAASANLSHLSFSRYKEGLSGIPTYVKQRI